MSAVLANSASLRADLVARERAPQHPGSRYWTLEQDVAAVKRCIERNEANIRMLFESHMRAPGNLEVGLRLGRLEEHREVLQDELAAAVARLMKAQRGDV